MKTWSHIIANTPLGLTSKGLDYCLSVVGSPPSRTPSNSSRRNLTIDFISEKMGCAVQLESLTVEGGYVQTIELLPEVIGYWPQPQPITVSSVGRDGVARSIRRTPDLMVLYPDRVELVECKRESELLKLSLEQPKRFTRDPSGIWRSPEFEEALHEYGIRFRVFSDADLNPTRLRNDALLADLRNTDYSSELAVVKLHEQVPADGSGLPLATIIAKQGNGYSKNDVYLAIMKRDLIVLLDSCLLADDKTTLVFSTEHHASVHRLLRFENKPVMTRPLVLEVGTKVTWNGTEYTVCNVSDDRVYFQPSNGSPIPFPTDLLASLVEKGEVQLPEVVAQALADHEMALKPWLKTFSDAALLDAEKKRQFLLFRKSHPSSKSQDFGLGPVSNRTIQRWAASARLSDEKFGCSTWGLLAIPRVGRPRHELPAEMREAIAVIADELYFTAAARTARCCWRMFRKRRKEAGKEYCSPGAFARQLTKLKNFKAATEARQGTRAAYKFGEAGSDVINWATVGDFPYKVAQLDSKLMDIEVVDDETGELLGSPTLSLATLPHYGSAPIGRAFTFEPPSYRSATTAVSDTFDRQGDLPNFLLVDNGKEFNNTNFDRMLASLNINRINRPPNCPRYSAEIESLFRSMDVELVHNLAGNTKALGKIREMTKDMHPETHAVWTLAEFSQWLDHYLFELLWDAPAATLGTTPRKALERDQLRAPDRSKRLVLPATADKIAFWPEVKDRTRVVQPGRGVWVEGYYYWNDLMRKPGVEKSEVVVRYNPADLYVVSASIDGKWTDCEALHAPELRNSTEHGRHLQVLAHRRLRKTHGIRREATHGAKLADMHEAMLRDEKLLKAARRQRANKSLDVAAGQTNEPSITSRSATSKLPKMNFRHLRNSNKKVA